MTQQATDRVMEGKTYRQNMMDKLSVQGRRGGDLPGLKVKKSSMCENWKSTLNRSKPILTT